MAQITITLTLPDDKEQLILNAFCKRYGFSGQSQMTKVQFYKREIARYTKEPYIRERLNEEYEKAVDIVNLDVDSFDIT